MFVVTSQTKELGLPNIGEQSNTQHSIHCHHTNHETMIPTNGENMFQTN